MTEIKPETGTEYLIYAGGGEGKSFKGIYIGKKPVETHGYMRLPGPEGHLFVRENEGEIEMYCTRTPEEMLTLMWWSDGDDGPEWPAGVPVERVETKLSNLEEGYLRDRIKKLEEQGVAA